MQNCVDASHASECDLPEKVVRSLEWKCSLFEENAKKAADSEVNECVCVYGCVYVCS
jgi:hypothetical protein